MKKCNISSLKFAKIISLNCFSSMQRSLVLFQVTASFILIRPIPAKLNLSACSTGLLTQSLQAEFHCLQMVAETCSVFGCKVAKRRNNERSRIIKGFKRQIVYCSSFSVCHQTKGNCTNPDLINIMFFSFQQFIFCVFYVTVSKQTCSELNNSS